MRLRYTLSLLLIGALFLLSALTAAAPTSPNFPTPDLKTLISARYTCANYAPYCGGLTAANNIDGPNFGQGDCIPLADNMEKIYVGNCYCVLWETCTGDLRQDAPGLIGAMAMCEGPKLMKKFRKMPRFISCGGQH